MIIADNLVVIYCFKIARIITSGRPVHWSLGKFTLKRDNPLLKTVLIQCTSAGRSETKERQLPLHLTEQTRRMNTSECKTAEC